MHETHKKFGKVTQVNYIRRSSLILLDIYKHDPTLFILNYNMKQRTGKEGCNVTY